MALIININEFPKVLRKNEIASKKYPQSRKVN